jgi:hypothetical protein
MWGRKRRASSRSLTLGRKMASALAARRTRSELAELHRRAARCVEAGNGQQNDSRRFNGHRREQVLPNEFGRQRRPLASHLLEKDANLAFVRAGERFAGGDRGVMMRVAFASAMAVIAVAMMVSHAFAGRTVNVARGEVVQSVAEQGNPAVKGE